MQIKRFFPKSAYLSVTFLKNGAYIYVNKKKISSQYCIMKTIVNLLLALFWVVTLSAQTYAPNELIIRFEATATNTDRQDVRTLYGITNTTPLGEDLELWKGITFPLPVTESGSTTVLNNIEELLNYIIEIQETGHSNNTTANINEGNFNLDVFLDDIGALHEGGTFDPFPFCDDVHNSRVIGPDQSGNPAQNHIKILIVDQVVSNIPSVEMNSGPDFLGGTHGQKVYSVISNILTQAGLTQVEYINLPVFDNTGAGTSAALIEMSTFIKEQYNSGNWSASDFIMVNFSANIVYTRDFLREQGSSILDKSWISLFYGQHPEFEKLFLVSSAGNQATNSNRIFPGTREEFEQQICVAGTQNCFLAPWGDTNFNPIHYEIAAEAENILTFDGTNYQLSSGTSFAAPQVTAAIAQVAAAQLITQTGLNMSIKDFFLQNMPTNPALTSIVQQGKVLDISGRFGGNPSGQNSGQNFLQSTTPAPALTLQTTPNPFSQNAIVNIGVAVGQSPHLSLYNSIGQLVHQELIPNQQELTELQWYTPDQLARGTYLLRVQVGDKVEQQMIVKQ
ncbi:MAG: S8 family peptidase [Bacteroidota bacterium]